jgi:hypothetical protein
MWKTIVLAAVVVILVGAIAVVGITKGGFFGSQIIKDSGSNISDYSAVFLTNGQVYFGKLYTGAPTGDLDLRDIYYLQVNQQIQPNQKDSASSPSNTSNQSNVVLVKLGQELHGPNDRMLINKEQVLFTESLKNDSKVVTAINNYTTKK